MSPRRTSTSTANIARDGPCNFGFQERFLGQLFCRYTFLLLAGLNLRKGVFARESDSVLPVEDFIHNPAGACGGDAGAGALASTKQFVHDRLQQRLLNMFGSGYCEFFHPFGCFQPDRCNVK